MPWPAPTNPCSENKKIQKNLKQQNKKEKIFQPTSPVVSSNNFFDEICALALPRFEPPTSNLTRTFLTTTLHNHLWLNRACYSFILTLKSICMVRSRHHPSLEIHFQGRMTTLRAHKNIFLFYSKSLFKSLYIEE